MFFFLKTTAVVVLRKIRGVCGGCLCSMSRHAAAGASVPPYLKVEEAGAAKAFTLLLLLQEHVSAARQINAVLMCFLFFLLFAAGEMFAKKILREI